MKCERCGTQNPAGALVCANCGGPLASAELPRLRRYLPAGLQEQLQAEWPAPSPRLLEYSLSHLERLTRLSRSYLPAYLVERLARHPVAGQSAGQFIEGTLLFADVSGFTAMSERLSQIGREGAEEISALINGYFSAMLTLLRDSGGHLIKFGGDALLGLFLEPDSATRAVQAALNMQAAMAEFTETRTSQGVFPLYMKVGLHRGRFFAAQLGTVRTMEYALFGADVNATAAAESAASKGEVVLDRTTLAALTAPCRARPRPGQDSFFVVEGLEAVVPAALAEAAPILPGEPATAGLISAVSILDALTPYLPTGLLARLASDTTGGLGHEGEHRLVAALFANVHGLGHLADAFGPGREPDIVAALNAYFVAMDDAIQSFGGVVNKIDLYDHGDKLLAFFGAPVAHEDDAERAVRAALQMQSALSGLQPPISGLRFRQHIGLSANHVFAGYVGTEWRREYTVMGDSVNLAARLMGVAAPDGIIISSDIHQKVSTLFQLTPRGDVAVKGKSDLIPTFSVEAALAAAETVRGLEGLRSPLVGRQAEWEQLRAAAEALTPRSGQIISLVSEAGLGKSRLGAELRQHLDAHRPMRWLEGRCLSYTESTGFYPFLEVVRQLLGAPREASMDEYWKALRATLARLLPSAEAEAHLPYLANVVNLPLPAEMRERVRYLDAEALQKQTFLAVRTLLDAYVRAETAAVALVLKDLHWCDQASLALLEYLLPLVERLPLLVLLIYRPEHEHASWRTHEQIAREFGSRAAQIMLGPLTPQETQRLLNALVPLEHWPEALQNVILSRTEGNPLYLEELIRVLLTDGTLSRDAAGRWQLAASGENLQVPDSLQGVLMSRLDRLEEPSRRTAQVSSVIGRAVPYELLTHAATELSEALETHVAGLQRREIVDEAQRKPERIYTFRHGLMQEVCYGSLLARTRRLYHARIAEYLEVQRADDALAAERRLPLLAHHAFAGQDWPRALRYQMLAGQQSQALFANAEALDHFEKALHSAEQMPADETALQRQAIHAALGELLTLTGKYEAAYPHLIAAKDLAAARGEAEAAARACRWLARTHELRSEWAPALEWIDQGLHALQGRETAEAAELTLISGLIASRQGEHERAHSQAQAALAVARKLNEIRVIARADNLLGHIARLRGQNAEALQALTEALSLYQRAGDSHGQALVHNQMANAYFSSGQWPDADASYRRARDIFAQMGDRYHFAITNNNLGGIAANQGRLGEAIAFYEEALGAFTQIGASAYVIGIIHMNLGAAYLRQRALDQARHALTIGRQSFEQTQSRDFLPEMHRHLARVELISGRAAEAEAECRQALAFARELKMRGEEGNALRVLGEVFHDQKRLAEAIPALRESVAILADVADEYELARSRFSLARVLAAQGQRAEALMVLDLALAIFERLEARLDAEAARALRAELAPA